MKVGYSTECVINLLMSFSACFYDGYSQGFLKLSNCNAHALTQMLAIASAVFLRLPLLNVITEKFKFLIMQSSTCNSSNPEK